ncbi:MAG TPA: HAD-IA family hydrolase [Candidatus Dojkabacteria bacterium]|nr:HAD-IA family hydrolase [Candidatus Dojkabacteria bacterium]
MDRKYYIKYWLFKNKNILVTKKFSSIYDIKFKKDKSNLLIFDVDDTLGENGGVIPDESIDYLYDLKERGYKIAVISNADTKRTKYFEERLKKIKPVIITKSQKPNPASFYKIFELTKSSNKEATIIGDRSATDLFGAYLAGIPNRYLVTPYSDLFGGKKPPLPYRLARRIENTISARHR